MKKLVIAVVLGIVAVGPAAAYASSGEGTAFVDVPTTHWAAGVIHDAVEKGYVNGYKDHAFKPDASVTRAEFIRMVASALQLPVPSGDGEDWYQPYVQALQDAELLKNTDFTGSWSDPATWNHTLSRMEMVRMEVRAANPVYADPNYSANDASFMYQATKTGLISGTDNGALDPQGNSTRAQAVAVIERILAVKAGKTLTPDKRAMANAEIDLKGTNMESMLGVKPKPFPISFNQYNDPKIKITLDKAVVLDCDNPDVNPTNDWLQYVNISSASGPDPVLHKAGYVIAYHFTYQIEKHGGDHPGFWKFTPQFSDPYDFTYIMTEKFEEGSIGIYPIKDGDLSYTHTTDGWLIFYLPKNTPHNTDMTAPQIQNGREVEEFYILNE